MVDLAVRNREDDSLIRQLMRFATVMVVAFLAVIAVMQVTMVERSFPLGADQAFSLDFTHATATKGQAIAEMSRIADEYSLQLTKVGASPDDFRHGRDAYWFGSHPPAKPGPIDWFDPTVHGVLRPASEIGSGSLQGVYSVSGARAGVVALADWGASVGVDMNSQRQYSAQITSLELLAKTGGGVATLAVLMLMGSTVLAWFGSQARGRALRLLAGVSPARVHREDVGFVVRLVVMWAALAAVAAAAVVIFVYGPSHVAAFVSVLSPLVIGVLAVMILLATVVSLATRPSVLAIARRDPAARPFSLASWGIKAASLVMALAVLPGSLTYVNRAERAADSAARWEHIAEVVAVRDGGPTEDNLEPYYPRVGRFFDDAAAEGIAALSYPVGELLVSEADQLGPYDEVVLVNPVYLALWSSKSEEPTAGLRRVEPASLSLELSDAMAASFEIWTANGSDGVGDYELYTAAATGAPSFLRRGGDGTFIDAEHPLIVLVDDPIAEFDVPGFLHPAMSTGNLVFTDAERVTTLIDRDDMTELVHSVDRLGDVALTWAQTWEREVYLRAAAVGLVLVALVLAVILGAQTWAGQRAREVFARHAAGERYLSIARRRLVGEAVLVATAAVGAVALASFTGTRLEIAAATTAVVVVPYAVLATLSYRHEAARAFRRAAHRTAS